MTLSARRIAFGVVVLGCLAAAAMLLFRVSPQPRELKQPVAPVMDVADPQTRRALSVLVSNKAAHFGGAWLGDRCDEYAPSERYVYTRQDFGSGVIRSTLLEPKSDGGSFHFVAQASSRWPVRRRSWGMDAAAMSAFDQLLVDARFPADWPAGDAGFCAHASTITFESCVNGRYHGVVRSCDLPGSPVLRLADGLDALMLRSSNGETGRLAAAAADEKEERPTSFAP
jgi:hypothetical protein